MVTYMSVQRTRLLIRGAATVLLLSSATLIAWAFQSPVAVDDQADLMAAKRVASKKTKLVGSPPLKDFAKVWKTELRRPLYDPPPLPKEDKKDSRKKRRREAVPDAGGLRLVGTMLEDGRSMAIFTDATGKVDFKAVGETLDLSPGARVDQIELTQVTISEQGRATVLRLPNTRAQ
jgi:hypothetical protein